MKHSRLFFSAILVPIDYLMVLMAAFVTYAIRFLLLRDFRAVITEIPVRGYVNIAALVALGWILLFAANGLYPMRRLRITEEMRKVIFGCSTGFVAVMIYLVFSQALFSSRFVLLSTYLLAIVFVAGGRLAVRILERLTLAQGIGTVALALVGNPASRLALVGGFTAQPSLGYRVVSEFDRLTPTHAEEMKKLQAKENLDGIVLTDPNASSGDALAAMNLAEDLHVRFFYSANIFAAASSNIATHTFAGIPIIEIKKTRLEGWGRIWKRLFDLVGSFLLIIITAPITLLAALAVILETGRPIFFKNERIGEHGAPFDLLKFRSMQQKYSIGKQFGNQAAAIEYEKKLLEEKKAWNSPVYKMPPSDPRITRVGQWLRRWSIDELPQLWNVFCGQMSLVGPRPHQPREVEKYARHHRHVLAIKPGITGLAQISGRRDLDFEDEIRLDTYYIENWSLAFDLFILAKTPFVVLWRRGAY